MQMQPFVIHILVASGPIEATQPSTHMMIEAPTHTETHRYHPQHNPHQTLHTSSSIELHCAEHTTAAKDQPLTNRWAHQLKSLDDSCFLTLQKMHMDLLTKLDCQINAPLHAQLSRPALVTSPHKYSPCINNKQQTFKVWQPQRAARSKRPNTPSDGSKHNGFQTTNLAVLILKHVSRQDKAHDQEHHPLLHRLQWHGKQ